MTDKHYYDEYLTLDDDLDICLHCKHLKRKYLFGKLVSDYCEKPISGVDVHSILRCPYFKRSWKSRLGLVKE